MAYLVEVLPSAAKALAAVNKRDRLRLVGVIELLAVDPFPPSATRLRGREGWRVRVGDYRILYSAGSRSMRILLVKRMPPRPTLHP